MCFMMIMLVVVGVISMRGQLTSEFNSNMDTFNVHIIAVIKTSRGRSRVRAHGSAITCAYLATAGDYLSRRKAATDRPSIKGLCRAFCPFKRLRLSLE